MSLSASDREFFSVVAAAVFANPFSREREQLNARLAGSSITQPSEDPIERALKNVAERLARMEKDGKVLPSKYAAEDGGLLEIALLFDVFHRFIPAFDQLILTQQASGDETLSVPFASEALTLLHRRGFTAADALRYFSIFFQLRRAYYFIAHSLIGASPCMRALRERLWMNVFTGKMTHYVECLWNRMEDFSTLLLGETGTGKGAAAHAIGRSGFIPFVSQKNCFAESFTRGYVALNLSQFPESLIESELFGHRKGSFTGAIHDYDGVFSRCSEHGAIFLDEIGDLSLPVQIKLLKVLQERVFSPVGSHESKRFAGRVIAATNKSLDDLRRTGHFRDDFYYRLCSDVIVVPPLRQRLQESSAEMEQLISLVVRRTTGKDSQSLVAEICDQLHKQPGRDYPWPGNVRELEQAVRRILLTGEYRGAPSPVALDPEGELLGGIRSGALSAEGLLGAYCRLLWTRHGTYEEVARRTGLDWRTAKKYAQHK
ncbi:MAG: sigma 54-interacting transcriptional regulator [Lentisphaerota bacterium]